jgi:hypothetical protein
MKIKGAAGIIPAIVPGHGGKDGVTLFGKSDSGTDALDRTSGQKDIHISDDWYVDNHFLFFLTC